jgi:hypothetical protein
MAKVYAHHKTHAVHAVLNGYYHFASEEQAMRQLQILCDTFLMSRYKAHPHTPKCVVMWIRGYGLSDEDRKNGVLGHFAMISCHKVAADKWSFNVKKLVDDAPHPQKRRTPQQHPNWGHPILRSVEKKKVYPTIEAAQGELVLLQQEYPHVAVPGAGCLFIAIYERGEDKKARRVKRYVLEIEPLKEGGYVIAAKEKKPKPKTPAKTTKKTPPLPTTKKPKEPVGFFTSKVALKRTKKKP